MACLIADISPLPMKSADQSAYNQHLNILNAMLSVDLTMIRTRGEAESVLSERITSEKTRGIILKNLQRTSENRFKWKLNVTVSLQQPG